ncbi:MAG: type II secretion system secretin GspD, partial [Gemmatimonadaceae bacterium]|nr:type II secretion system secretin GspD [Gemmatimonadaceae bacterium]
DNLQRLGRIISALDVTNATDVEVIPLRHQLAPDIAPVVQRLLDSSTAGAVAPGQGQADTSFRTTIVAESRSNTLLIRAANPARLSLVRSIVAKLDQPGSDSATGNIYVVYLENADATKLAVTLRAALSANTAGTGGSGISASPGVAGASPSSTPIAASAQPSTGGQIQADPSTNSLIITAAEPQYRQIRAVIERLDARRAQVFVESLIAEVNADKAAEFGIQWQNVFGTANSSKIGVIGTNFTVGGANILSLQQGTAAPSSGINLGVLRNVNGTYVLATLARFLQTNGDGNILSTPTLLTLDNEEAKIVIGQNVPFVTGQYTNSNGGTNGSVNPFQTIERKDVGLTLRVKPQISENGTVKMQIFQEVSSVQASSINSATGLITNKRSIESNVLVDDGAIVVLGGLLSDEFSDNQEKVPVLGDVPLFGNLFRSETRSRKKTNLMVFLRPVVVRDSAQSDALSLDRYDLMRTLTEGQGQPAPSITGVNGAATLPAITPVVRQPGTVPAPLGR